MNENLKKIIEDKRKEMIEQSNIYRETYLLGFCDALDWLLKKVVEG